MKFLVIQIKISNLFFVNQFFSFFFYSIEFSRVLMSSFFGALFSLVLLLESSLESPFVSAVILVDCSISILGSSFHSCWWVVFVIVSWSSIFSVAASLSRSLVSLFYRYLSLVLSFYFADVIFSAAISQVVD